ncbi:MAG: hypothetical protein VKJ04_01635 [Vampirovibrionales bacterium]|nr:hypothetical protein [Vampirovibrionales bacterium]
MPDNFQVTAGSGTTVATKDASGVHHPKQMIEFDSGGTPTLVSGSNPLPVDVKNASIPVTDNGGSLTVDGTVSINAIPAGSNNIGDVDIASALPAGDNNIGNVDIVTLPSLPAGTNNIGDVDVLTLPGVAGDIAHDGADSGNPVKIGGKAKSAEPTAVANNDRAELITDLVGKQIVLPYALPENLVAGTTSDITNTTSTSVIAAAGAGIRNYITSLTITNSHASVGTWVNITDGSGGTVLLTVYAAPTGGGVAKDFPTPLKTTANTALHAVCATSGATVRVSASGYTGR